MTFFLWALLILAGLAAAAALALFAFGRMTAAKVMEAMQPRGRFVDVDGARIHLVEKGDGPPIIMIHGLSGNLHNFTYATTEPLAGEFRVIAIDRPGCGHSERDSDDLARIPEQARLIAQWLEDEGIEKPLVAGHSLGGAIALALALNHPERVGALGLIAPLTAVQDEAPEVFSGINMPNPGLRRLVADFFSVPGAIRNGPAVLAAIFAPNPPPEDFRTRGGGLLSLRPDAFYAAATDMAAVPLDIADMPGRYGELRMPVGVIFGDADIVLDPETHLAPLRAIPGLEEVILPGVGHMVQINRPDETEEFLRRMAAKLA